jgi:hypothetical protein
VLFYLDEKRVLIAVIKDLLHTLNIAGSLPFLPILMTRAAPKPGYSGLNSALQGLGIHIGDHENLKTVPVLDDRRDQSVFVELQITGYLHAGLLS